MIAARLRQCRTTFASPLETTSPETYLSLDTEEENDQSRMRVIVPYPRTSLGGVERLTCSVVRELTNLVEAVVWVLPDNLLHLTRAIPRANRLIVESLAWPAKSWQASIDGIAQRYLVELANRRESELAQLTAFENNRKAQLLRTLRLQFRLEHLIRKYRVNRCLFTWTLHVPVPRLHVPIVAIIHDRNWRKFPENFPYTTPARLDTNTKQWMTAAHKTITPSRSVQQEVSELGPEFAAKTRVVPEASEAVGSMIIQSHDGGNTTDPTPMFYHPSTVGAHKGHLTLFKAALKLASEGHRFKVVLTGDRTRFLTGSEPMPLPIIPYVEQCRNFYVQNISILSQCIENLDLCEPERVEQLYCRARRVVLPSTYEGFGLPLIEAMARGVRVICSDIDPYLEQIELYKCAEFVQVFRADDFQGLAAYMQQSLANSDPQRLSALEAESICKRWTWHDAARAIVSIMQETNTPPA